MKKPIDFNQSGFDAHLKDIQKAEAVLLELVSKFKELVGYEPKDFEDFIKDPYTYTGELITQGVKVEGMELSLEKKLFLKDINLKTIHTVYEELNKVVKEEVLKDIKDTYTTYAVTKGEKDFHKHFSWFLLSFL